MANVKRLTQKTLRPGEMTAASLADEVDSEDDSDEEAWRRVNERVQALPDPYAAAGATAGVEMTRLAFRRAKAAKGSKAGRTGPLWVVAAAQFVCLAILAGAFGMHLMSDSTTRAKALRTEQLVEWLAKRALAIDAGEKPPAFPVL